MKLLCLDFINSRWYLTHKPYRDPLDQPDWLAQFCAAWVLPAVTPSGGELDDLKQFREDLFELFWGLCTGQSVKDSRIAWLNEILEETRPYRRLVHREGQYDLQTCHDTDDLAWVKYQIAMSAAELLAQRPLERLKKCENPACDWIFYDDSKSHARKWCDNKCASLMKVRKYRARKKAPEQ